jgi:aspartate aminotransferase
MAQINKKMYGLGTVRSAIRDLFEYGNERAAIVGRENVYDYSLGNPSIEPPAKVGKTIIELESTMNPVSLHGYTSAAGDPQVRAKIAADLNNRFGCTAAAGDFYMTCGAAASLTISLTALKAGDDDEYIAIAPFFPEYQVFAEATGAKFVVCPADEKHFQIDFDALERVITSHTKGIIVDTPNNPSGTVLTPENVKKLVDLLERKNAEYGHPIYLLADEPYRELVYDEGVKVPFFPNEYTYSIVCYSYSKSLSLPGERIGYIYVPSQMPDSAEIMAAVAGAGRALGFVCAPAMMQRVAAECTDLTADLAAYKKNRDALYGALTEMGFECVHPDGAFYIFMKCPGGDAQAFSKKAMEYDLLLVPSDSFGVAGYVRLAYCVSYDMIMRSIPVFRKLAEATLKA